jgi:nucleoside-diphosphate-sugar epimerase
MNRVLITGIDSFTGVHLSKYLEKAGYDIYGTSLIQSGGKKFKCDITSKSDLLEVLGEVKTKKIIKKSKYFLYLN